jgi:hypothetical protein
MEVDVKKEWVYMSANGATHGEMQYERQTDLFDRHNFVFCSDRQYVRY